MSMYKQEYINCDFEVTSPQYISTFNSIKQLRITHAVHNKATISFNSSMLKKLKSPESSFIHKSLIKIVSFSEYTCLSI